MGYVQDGQHDIFVSYAHVDNQPLEGTDRGWVTTLVGNLSNFLARKLGTRSVSLWMDRELAGHAPFTPAIMDAVRQTATLVVVVSPAYLNSEWCSRERETFLKLVRERSRSDSRVFMVEIDKVDRNDLPAEFGGLLGYRFWVQDREGRAPRTLATPKPSPDEREYWDRLLDLSDELAQELKRLKAMGQVQARDDRPDAMATPQGPAIFLAETTDDLEEEREEVKGYLKQARLRVLPESYYPRDDPAAFKQMMEKDLAQCTVFVQLLSGIAGRKPAGFPQGYPGLQHDCAAQANKVILQWRSRDLDVDKVRDSDYRHLLEESTVQATGLEEFKRAIVEEARRSPKPPVPHSPNIFVFVNADFPDHTLAEAVHKWLLDHNLESSMPFDHGDPSKNREDLEDNLRNCDAVIIIYGASSASWVRYQLLQNRKIIAEREKPLLALVVFEGPPAAPPKVELNIGLRNMRTVKCHNGLDDTALREFVESLGGKSS